MKKELELEAEKYAWKKKNPFSKELLANELVFTSKTDFIAGATSKWVEKQKLEFVIDTLYLLRCSPSSEIDIKIEEFEQKLKEYETN